VAAVRLAEICSFSFSKQCTQKPLAGKGLPQFLQGQRNFLKDISLSFKYDTIFSEVGGTNI